MYRLTIERLRNRSIIDRGKIILSAARRPNELRSSSNRPSSCTGGRAAGPWSWPRTSPYLVPKLRMSGVVLPLLCNVCMACKGTTVLWRLLELTDGLTNTGAELFLRKYIYIYIGFKTSFYVVRHLGSIAFYLPTGLHLGFFRSWPSLYLPTSFSSVFLVPSFVSASTSMLFWVIFLLPFFEHGSTT